MSTILNGSPRVILEGTKDASVRSVPPEPLLVPMHLPMFFSFAERGPSITTMGSIGDLKSVYGSKTFDRKSIYALHPTPFIERIGATGNSMLFKRMIPADATQAKMVVWATLTPTELPTYQRDEEGKYILDGDGNPIDSLERNISGYKVRWETLPKENDAVMLFGKDAAEPDEGRTVVRLPIFEFAAGSVGEYGNNLGVRFSIPTVSNLIEPDVNLAVSARAIICRIQFVERTDTFTTPIITANLNGERQVDFTLKPGVVDMYGVEKYVDQAVIPAYEDSGTPGRAPVYAPIGKMHFYRENFVTLATLVNAAEKAAAVNAGVLSDITGNLDMEETNIFTAKTITEVPYLALVIDHVSGSALLSEKVTHYLHGGEAGDISRENLDAMVTDRMMYGWDDAVDALADSAMNPMSIIWDSGYGIEAKKALCETLKYRADTAVALTTFVSGVDALSWVEEESLANMLQGYAAGYPESVIHGTPCCRAIVIGGQGTVIDGTWNHQVPVSLDLATKVGQYMGASNGRMTSGLSIDSSPNNQISILKDITGLYKSERQRQKDWSAGLIWAQAYDRRTAFYPQYQTVYPEDTSVLNSMINMFIMVELQKVCVSVWRDLTNNSQLNNDQFIERSNTLITERTVNRFDGRVVIQPETFFTVADNARGYSWSCNVHMYANNMKTVGTFTVTAHRMEDLV